MLLYYEYDKDAASFLKVHGRRMPFPQPAILALTGRGSLTARGATWFASFMWKSASTSTQTASPTATRPSPSFCAPMGSWTRWEPHPHHPSNASGHKDIKLPRPVQGTSASSKTLWEVEVVSEVLTYGGNGRWDSFYRYGDNNPSHAPHPTLRLKLIPTRVVVHQL